MSYGLPPIDRFNDKIIKHLSSSKEEFDKVYLITHESFKNLPVAVLDKCYKIIIDENIELIYKPNTLTKIQCEVLFNNHFPQTIEDFKQSLDKLKQRNDLFDLLSFALPNPIKLFDDFDECIFTNDKIVFVKDLNFTKTKTSVCNFTATPLETLLKKFINFKYEKNILPKVKNVGRIIQYKKLTGSKTQLDNKQKLIEYNNCIKEHNLNMPNLIIQKGYVSKIDNELFNASNNFGNVSGLNEWSGKDLIVVGKPDINPEYLKSLYVLKNKENIPNDLLARIKHSNGLFLVKDELLSKIELEYMILQTEQAIGRARTLWNDCNVLVINNLPLDNVDLIE